jgi:hypothetical protein
VRLLGATSGRLATGAADARSGRAADVPRSAIGAAGAPASPATQLRSRRHRVPCDAAAARPRPAPPPSADSLPRPLKAQPPARPLRADLAPHPQRCAKGRHDPPLLAELAPAADPSAGAPSLRPVPATLRKGHDLRRVAARLLWQTERTGEMQYREWLDRVLAAVHAVGGKDATASLLTNVRDPPAVVRGSRPGFYRLDPSNARRARRGAGGAARRRRRARPACRRRPPHLPDDGPVADSAADNQDH